jgi:hypothetical protein
MNDGNMEIKQPMAIQVLQQVITEVCKLPLVDVRLMPHSVRDVGMLVHRHSGRHRRLAAAEPQSCQCSSVRTCDACYNVFTAGEENLDSSSSIQSNSESSLV